jgi:hypothetical protein
MRMTIVLRRPHESALELACRQGVNFRLPLTAGVVRLLRRAAELASARADEGGPRSSRQLFALAIDSAADEASSLLPRWARLEGPTPAGQNPAELLASAEHLLHQICLEGAPSRRLSFRALVGELIWEANTSAGP